MWIYRFIGSFATEHRCAPSRVITTYVERSALQVATLRQEASSLRAALRLVEGALKEGGTGNGAAAGGPGPRLGRFPLPAVAPLRLEDAADCPRNCSGDESSSGCVRGRCICRQGFGGVDCAFSWRSIFRGADKHPWEGQTPQALVPGYASNGSPIGWSVGPAIYAELLDRAQARLAVEVRELAICLGGGGGRYRPGQGGDRE